MRIEERHDDADEHHEHHERHPPITRGRLVLNAAGGLIALALVGIWRPIGGPVLLSIAACFVAYGLWGIADRELAERRQTAAPAVAVCLKVVRAFAVVAGAAAAVTALFSALALALGTWIS